MNTGKEKTVLPECPFGEDQIKMLIPHRHPFLFVHKVLSCDLDNHSLEAEYLLDHDSFFLKGHYESRPLMPGVLMLEGMAQAACILGVLSAEFIELSHENGYVVTNNKRGDSKSLLLPYLASLQDVKFHSIVVPGDVITFRVRLLRRKMKLFMFTAEAAVGDAVVASATIRSIFAEDEND